VALGAHVAERLGQDGDSAGESVALGETDAARAMDAARVLGERVLPERAAAMLVSRAAAPEAPAQLRAAAVRSLAGSIAGSAGARAIIALASDADSPAEVRSAALNVLAHRPSWLEADDVATIAALAPQLKGAERTDALAAVDGAGRLRRSSDALATMVLQAREAQSADQRIARESQGERVTDETLANVAARLTRDLVDDAAGA
jgi:hypothetical protein